MLKQNIKQIEHNKFGEVNLITTEHGMQFIEVTHDTCQGKISLYGGQVLSWQPQGQEDVFWVSASTEYRNGKAIRGGIPLCWPWFGGYKDAGNHGFVRTQTWQLHGVKLDEYGIDLVITWQGEQQHALWPHKAKLTQTLFFGEHFKQQLLMENLSEQMVQYTGALHSYFNISHPQDTNVNQLNHMPFDCKLSGGQQERDVRENVVGPVDRIYYTANDIDIVDSGYNRIIKVSANNTQQWVLWNPGHETAQAMADIHDGGENEFFCLEAANTQWQDIAPKQSVEISQIIQVLDKTD